MSSYKGKKTIDQGLVLFIAFACIVVSCDLFYWIFACVQIFCFFTAAPLERMLSSFLLNESPQKRPNAV